MRSREGFAFMAMDAEELEICTVMPAFCVKGSISLTAARADWIISSVSAFFSPSDPKGRSCSIDSESLMSKSWEEASCTAASSERIWTLASSKSWRRPSIVCWDLANFFWRRSNSSFFWFRICFCVFLSYESSRACSYLERSLFWLTKIYTSPIQLCRMKNSRKR